jgi:hypothetical protein
LAIAAIVQAAPIQFTLNNNGTSSWFLSSGSVGPTGSQNPNPTLTLSIGARYEVTVANSPFHVFELLAKGPTDAQDAVLLSQDDSTAAFNSDPGVNFTGFGTGVSQFTLTSALAAAMTDAGQSQTPGYRCGIHTMTMRGDVSLVPEPATLSLLLLGGLALVRRRR